MGLSNANSDILTRSKTMIVKCLNRITTETEISAAHSCHFLLGYSDSKTSHKFTRLNLYTGLAWLASEIKKYDNLCAEAVLPEMIGNTDHDKDPHSDSDDDNNIS